jgi:hypothetical protein
MTGLEILTRALEAAGGEIWQNPQTLFLEGTASFSPHGFVDETHFLHFDHYALYRVFPLENTEAHRANGKVRIDATYDKNVFFKLKFDGQKSNMFMSDVAKRYGKYFEWSNNFGFSIIRHGGKEGFETIRLADDQVEGFPCHFVQINDPKNNVTVFGIDSHTFNIRLVQFTTELGFHHRIYSDFWAADNEPRFMQAHRMRVFFEGIKWIDIHWKKAFVNQPLADEVFS